MLTVGRRACSGAPSLQLGRHACSWGAVLAMVRHVPRARTHPRPVFSRGWQSLLELRRPQVELPRVERRLTTRHDAHTARIARTAHTARGKTLHRQRKPWPRARTRGRASHRQSTRAARRPQPPRVRAATVHHRAAAAQARRIGTHTSPSRHRRRRGGELTARCAAGSSLRWRRIARSASIELGAHATHTTSDICSMMCSRYASAADPGQTSGTGRRRGRQSEQDKREREREREREGKHTGGAGGPAGRFWSGSPAGRPAGRWVCAAQKPRTEARCEESAR
eukprot:5638036-Prymnesium_polylepis.1